MKRILILLVFLTCLSIPVFGQANPPLTVQEIDGSPRGTNITTIKVTNGTLQINGRTATITISGGGGGSPGGSNTQVQYNNAGSFGGAAGFTFNGTSTISLGVAGSSVGAIGFRNATSGTITLQPVTGALGTVILSLPAVTDTLVGLAATQTLSNKTLASPTVTGNIVADATSRLILGGNEYRYTDGIGPYFYDNTTGATLRFNVQSLSIDRTVTWPDAALTVAGINVANAWADGIKQTFNPNGTTAGINVGSQAGDPSAPANGDLWYDSTANELTARINGANVALGGGGGSPGGSNTQFQFNNAGAFAGTTGVTYAASGAPTVSITGQANGQLTTLFTGVASSSSTIVGIQPGSGGGSNLIDFRNSSGTAISSVTVDGDIGAGITSSLSARS